jgi:probable DNA metabolism protein
MIIFRYDKTFDGLLTAVFDAYSRKTFPKRLLSRTEIAPLFIDEIHTVITQKEQSARVWKGITAKLSNGAANMIIYAWLSELDKVDELIFRYICKVFDTKKSIETNFSDNDILELKKIALKVNNEKNRIKQFTRFQKSYDEIYFAPISPLYNALPLSIEYLKDRFADQKWIIYDMKRKYGYYYDLKSVIEITLDDNNFMDGKLNDTIIAHDEKLFQELWKNYFKSITIKERINPKLHQQNLPTRFWKYLTEKQ